MRAITFSSSINAWSLHTACQRLGVRLFTTERARTFPLPFCGDLDSSQEDTRLLFTEEESLGRHIGNPKLRFYPPHFPRALLDDKLAFAEWLTSFGEKPVPTLPAPDAYPVLLKLRHSWRGHKLPRGWVCRGPGDWARAQVAAKEAGVAPSWLMVQPWYGDDCEVISVCGFFDARQPARNTMCVVRRLADQHERPACSAMVATVHDPAALVDRTNQILQRLDFAGPFELEFLGVRGAYDVLELNPRFWMQHALFTEAGNGLVKRCLDLDQPADWSAPPPSKLLWVDGVWLLIRLLRLDSAPLRTMDTWIHQRGYALVVAPPLPMALGLLLRKRWQKLAGRLWPTRHKAVPPC